MCVCWCVFGVCVCVDVGVSRSHPSLSHSSPRVHFQNVTVCTSTTPASVSTCARGAGTHGDVLNVHTEGVLSLHTGVIASSA